jgi:hypothetical protein
MFAAEGGVVTRRPGDTPAPFEFRVREMIGGCRPQRGGDPLERSMIR